MLPGGEWCSALRTTFSMARCSSAGLARTAGNPAADNSVMSAHPGEKVDAYLGNRNLGESVNRFAIGDLGFQANCLSRVRRESHARFSGGRVMATSPGYPTTYRSLFASLAIAALARVRKASKSPADAHARYSAFASITLLNMARSE